MLRWFWALLPVLGKSSPAWLQYLLGVPPLPILSVAVPAHCRLPLPALSMLCSHGSHNEEGEDIGCYFSNRKTPLFKAGKTAAIVWACQKHNEAIFLWVLPFTVCIPFLYSFFHYPVIRGKSLVNMFLIVWIFIHKLLMLFCIVPDIFLLKEATENLLLHVIVCFLR